MTSEPHPPRSGVVTIISEESWEDWKLKPGKGLTEMAGQLVIEVPDLAATLAWGRRLATLLFPGSVVALIGPLGAGKTHLVRAIAEGLAIPDSRVVTSPTFVLIQEYEARLPIYHFDAYRLRSPAEFYDLGAHEYFEGQGVCLVEWADRVQACLPADHLRIEMEVTGVNTRRLLVEGYGPPYEAIVGGLRAGAAAAVGKRDRP